MQTARALARTRIFPPLAALATLAACGEADSPEQQVRAVIDQIESAAENRDVGEFSEHLSEDFRDSTGMGADEVARYLRGYFIANQSIQLLTRIEQLDFPTDGEARAQVLVGMVGREAAAASQWDLAADLHTFKLALRREDGDWKVTFAEVMRSR
ncbi:MAG: hypothetical protein SXG53_18575 [Pseudomonadota bacterium]|nr:hypothetical protein [Pseudomonadota bacterium]